MICGKGTSTICSTIRSWVLGRRDNVGENAEENVLFSETDGVRGCVLQSSLRTDGGRGRTKEKGLAKPLVGATSERNTWLEPKWP